jgi:hypothetical protein
MEARHSRGRNEKEWYSFRWAGFILFGDVVISDSAPCSHSVTQADGGLVCWDIVRQRKRKTEESHTSLYCLSQGGTCIRATLFSSEEVLRGSHYVGETGKCRKANKILSGSHITQYE